MRLFLISLVALTAACAPIERKMQDGDVYPTPPQWAEYCKTHKDASC